jgi:hypothetical protein
MQSNGNNKRLVHLDRGERRGGALSLACALAKLLCLGPATRVAWSDTEPPASPRSGLLQEVERREAALSTAEDDLRRLQAVLADQQRELTSRAVAADAADSAARGERAALQSLHTREASVLNREQQLAEREAAAAAAEARMRAAKEALDERNKSCASDEARLKDEREALRAAEAQVCAEAGVHNGRGVCMCTRLHPSCATPFPSAALRWLASVPHQPVATVFFGTLLHKPCLQHVAFDHPSALQLQGMSSNFTPFVGCPTQALQRYYMLAACNVLAPRTQQKPPRCTHRWHSCVLTQTRASAMHTKQRPACLWRASRAPRRSSALEQWLPHRPLRLQTCAGARRQSRSGKPRLPPRRTTSALLRAACKPSQASFRCALSKCALSCW